MNIYLNLSGRSDEDQIIILKKTRSYLEELGHKIVYDYLSSENFEKFYKPTSHHVKHIFTQANELI